MSCAFSEPTCRQAPVKAVSTVISGTCAHLWVYYTWTQANLLVGIHFSWSSLYKTLSSKSSLSSLVFLVKTQFKSIKKVHFTFSEALNLSATVVQNIVCSWAKWAVSGWLGCWILSLCLIQRKAWLDPAEWGQVPVPHGCIILQLNIAGCERAQSFCTKLI